MSKPINFLKIMTPIAFAVALSACGSGADWGNDSGGDNVTSSGESSQTVTNADGTITTTTTFADGSTSVVTTDADGNTISSTVEEVATSLSLTASSRQLSSDGNFPVVLTAIAKDFNNNQLSGVNITFSVDGEANLSVDESTGSVKTASLTPDSKENRTLTVTATAGDITESLEVDVIGTSISISGPNSIAINTDNEYEVLLRDSDGGVIAFTDVNISSASGTEILTTDNDGKITFNYNSDIGGNDTLTVNALNATSEIIVDIAGSDFTLSGSTEGEVIINTAETVSLQWLIDNAAQAGETIGIRTTRGVLNVSEITTGANGVATFTITSDRAGIATVTAETSSGLTSNLDVEFIAVIPELLTSQSTPAVVGLGETSRIVSVVTDNNDNPVKNIEVTYSLNDAVNGVLSNSIAVTDASGTAEISYIAGNSASAFEGVEITTNLVDFPTIDESTTFLTVSGETSRISLVDNEDIAEDGVFYTKEFGVQVTDTSGRILPNQAVDFTITPLTYIKGFMQVVDGGWAQVITAVCQSEDLNRNGVRDPGEDLNGDGVLWPSNDASVSGSGETDESGSFVIDVKYGQNTSLWSTQLISATATVSGTETIEFTVFNMDILAEDVSSADVAPPNIRSPYGFGADCNNPL